MNEYRKMKLYLGVISVCCGFLGCFIVALLTFTSSNEGIYLFAPHNGSASYTPVMFGLIALAGAVILASEKVDK